MKESRQKILKNVLKTYMNKKMSSLKFKTTVEKFIHNNFKQINKDSFTITKLKCEENHMNITINFCRK